MQMNQERVDELVPRKETVVKQKLIDKINALGADSSTTAKDLTYLSKSLEVLNKKFQYHRWLHPWQGSWEVESLFTEEILTNLSK